ncbi:MAG TPA: hypothetical protein VFS33_09190 [Gemmatimonadales bacterium]|nr:hypothetical protein [Gemmatimonadales bacterium]
MNSAGPTLERRLRDAGLDPDRLDPWPAWTVFKTYARDPVDADGDIAYVQVGMSDPTDEFIHVTFIRELDLADDAGELEPVREIVCDLGYDPDADLPAEERELCSLDFETFDDFVAAVEADPAFRAAMALEPTGSLVSFNEL